MFVTAFYMPVVVFTFPPMVDFCVRFPNDLGLYKWRAIVDICMMIFGVLLLGVFLQVEVFGDLYHEFREPTGLIF